MGNVTYLNCCNKDLSMLLRLLALKKNLFVTFRIKSTFNHEFLINYNWQYILKAESPNNIFNFDYNKISSYIL